jgi:hypothetical protein
MTDMDAPKKPSRTRRKAPRRRPDPLDAIKALQVVATAAVAAYRVLKPHAKKVMSKMKKKKSQPKGESL